MAKLLTEDREIDLNFCNYDRKNRDAYYDTTWEELCYNTYNPDGYVFEKLKAYPEPEHPDSYNARAIKRFREEFIEATGLEGDEEIIAKLEKFGLHRVNAATVEDFKSMGLTEEEMDRMYKSMVDNGYRLKHMIAVRNYIYPHLKKYTHTIKKEQSIFKGGPLDKYSYIYRNQRKQHVEGIEVDTRTHEEKLDEEYKICDLETKLTKLPACDPRFKHFTMTTSYKLQRLDFDVLKECIDCLNFMYISKITRLSVYEWDDFIAVINKYYKGGSWLEHKNKNKEWW